MNASQDDLVSSSSPLSNSAGWGGWGNEEAEEVQNQLDQANNGPASMQAARHQATGCAAAGYTGCCTGENCKTDSGCYCDVKCYYFHNCCDDVTAIGCYRKCATYSSVCGFFVTLLNMHVATVCKSKIKK